MNVSVIINTLNRDFWLKRCMNSLFFQTYNNFEIVVVNGPSTDKTDEILLEYKDIIKIEKCDIPNLSLSRNIGIKASSGDIILFIDDDAVPMNKYWIEYYVKAFQNDPHLTAIGGKIYAGNGELQFCNKIMDFYGNEKINYSNDDLNNCFKIFGGGNGAYLRKALVEIGGFDEYYEYHHDETDLQARLTRAGKKLCHHPYANIYHEGAKSHNKTTNYIRDWYKIIKNSVYFGYKNTENVFDISKKKDNIIKSTKKYTELFSEWKKGKFVSKKEYDQIISMFNKGFIQGEYDGINSKRRLRTDLYKEKKEFKKINKTFANKLINICLYLPCSIFSDENIQKKTNELAQCLYNTGINIHILYYNNENIDYIQDGINYYSINHSYLIFESIDIFNSFKNTYNMSYKIIRKIQSLKNMFSLDIILIIKP